MRVPSINNTLTSDYYPQKIILRIFLIYVSIMFFSFPSNGAKKGKQAFRTPAGEWGESATSINHIFYFTKLTNVENPLDEKVFSFSFSVVVWYVAYAVSRALSDWMMLGNFSCLSVHMFGISTSSHVGHTGGTYAHKWQVCSFSTLCGNNSRIRVFRAHIIASHRQRWHRIENVVCAERILKRNVINTRNPYFVYFGVRFFPAFSLFVLAGFGVKIMNVYRRFNISKTTMNQPKK